MSISIEPTAISALPFPVHWTMADLQEHLGGIPANRIHLYPMPGTASEADALWMDDHEDRLCELVDGILVEKTMSSFESYVTLLLARLIGNFLENNDLGILLGEAGQLRILPTRIRIPDISFVRWERFPDGKLPKDRVYRVAPDLAVEVLSDGNTKREMELKLAEYFEAGTKLVWYIDANTRKATIYTSPANATAIDEQGMLDGGEVLPGFQVRLGEVFERATRGRQSK